MARRSYNGFSPRQRSRAGAWGRRQDAAGNRPPVEQCMVCGQRHGKLGRHSEDYSAPFEIGKTGRWHLCYRCHMALHLRERYPAGFDWYRTVIVIGATFAPMDGTQADFARVCKMLAQRHAPHLDGAPREDVFSDILAEGAAVRARAAEQLRLL